MAIVQKTIEYAFDTKTSTLAASTRYDFPVRTLTIEETSNRVFNSVILEVTARSQAATAASMTAWLLGVKVGTATNDVTVTSTVTNSGEHQSWKLMSGNLASHFNTNFGNGTTQSGVASVNFTGLATINVTAKLLLTYEFDDAAQTIRTKTVRIPLESPTVLLTATLAEIGTNQVPTLSGGGSPFLPEADVAVKDLFFEFEANEAATAVTDFNLALSLDAEGEVQDGSHEQALTSAVWYKYIWRRTNMDITTTHAFKARSTVASRFAMPTVTLIVTYTYNHTNSTRTINSIIVPVHQQYAATTVSFYKTNYTFTIAEPGPITLRQSGVRFNFTEIGVTDLQVKMGSQAARTYTVTQGSLSCGQYTVQTRIDSGASQGAGITLSSGTNTLSVQTFVDVAHTLSNISGYAIINYESNIDSLGADSHNHTTFWHSRSSPAAASGDLPFTPSMIPTISGTKYWLSATGQMFGTICTPTTAVTVVPSMYEIEVTTGERYQAHSDVFLTDAELNYIESWANTSKIWRRHPADPAPDRYSHIGGGIKDHRWYTSAVVGWKHVQSIITYHTIPFTVSGTITGYTGDGSGLEVVVRNPDREVIASGTSVAGGYYAITVYDSRPGYVADVYQDSIRVGRSDNIKPVHS
jgi:hypothetical protein